MRNIVLIGYRGTGKSTVGGILAERTGMECVSTDALIVARAGKTIPEIVEESGWDGFRDMETEIVREVSEREGVIIDAGGGAVLRDENIGSMRKNGTIILLTAEVGTIIERIGDDNQRPPLTEERSFTDEVAEVLAERMPRYLKVADIVVSTDERPPDSVADEIAGALNPRR